MSTHPLVETRVIRPIDKLVHADADYWPTFELQNVKILPRRKVKSRYARCVSLLDASAENPMCVFGELEEVEEQNLDRVVDSYQDDHEGLELVLPNVTNYCYGEEDGVCRIWAEGEAGWFEIQPSEQYQDVYIRMVEAITIWYFLEDQHNIRGTANARGTPRNPEVDTLFEVYLKKHREYETVETVESIFHSSQSFILSEMKKHDTEYAEEDELEDSGAMQWADTNIHQYFVEQSPEEINSSSDEVESSNEEEEIFPATTTQLPPSRPRPQKRLKSGKSINPAALRPKGLTPKSARHKSARISSALAMHLDSDEEAADGDEKRLDIVNEMKKAGASTGFLEAFLEERNEAS